MIIETGCPNNEISRSATGKKFMLTHFHSKTQDQYEPENPKHADCIVRYRGEPCLLVHVVEIIAAIKKKTVEEVVCHVYANAVKLFRLDVERPK